MVKKIIFGNVMRSWSSLKHIKKSTWIFLVELLLMIVLCYTHSLSAGHYAEYYPINGTFQNFNPVRRLAHGQIPYRDFQDYLGLGHLYMGTIFTTLFGGTYRDSLVAFSFLTFGSLALFSFVIGLAVFNKKEIAAAITNLVLVMLLVQPSIFIYSFSGTNEILEALKYALGTGNSARFVRGMILPILILLIWGAYKWCIRIAAKQSWVWAHKDLVAYIGGGMIAGFAFAWSNDYGICCWLCMAIMAFWVSVCRIRTILKSILNFLVEVFSSIVGLVISVMIFTRGHFLEWFSATFGTGGYQSWYYNSSKSYYLYDVDFSYIMIIQAGICIAYLAKLFVDRATLYSIRRYGILGFANMVCFCAVNEYQMLSGGSSREVALVVLFCTIVFELCALLVSEGKKKKQEVIAIVISCIVVIAQIVASAKDEIIFKYMTDKEGIYVEALGGNLTYLGDALLETNEFLDGKDFFATYASAQEVVSGTFQPSGTDYIIHVLGDVQRENYLEAFKTKDFQYAATIKETFDNNEYWIQRANWFFYRELYSNWHPVYSNRYEVYWKKNSNYQHDVVNNNIQFSVVDESATCKKLVVQTDESVNGIADVFIDYSVNKNNLRSANIIFQKALKVENTGTVYASQGSFFESNYLRSKSQEYIPVRVVNGYGEVTLTSEPVRSTYLQLNSASCNQIFTCTSDYLEILNVMNDDEKSVIYIENTAKNMNSLMSASEIDVQGNTTKIESISTDESNICVVVDTKINYSKIDGNYIEITKRGKK